MDTERPLGPWMKLYADVIERKAHYTDRQFRALIEVYVAMLRGRGLPPAKALRAKIGADEFDFLVSEGDLVTVDNAVTVYAWDRYQRVDRTNADRQARFRDRKASERGSTVDNAGVTDSNAVTKVTVPSSTSTSTSSETTNEEETTAVDARGNEFDSDDPIDAFYLVTAQFPPEGGKLRSWISDVASKGPSRRDFGIVLRDEWAKNGMKVPDTLRATEARLSKMGERARQAEGAERRRRANRSVFETPFMREFREAVAANYDKPQNGNGLTAVGDVVASLNGGQGLPLTDVGTPGSTGPTRDPGRSSPSSPEAVRPSSSGPPELPDGPGDEEGDDA
jgi:hypothetical protein